MYRKLDWVHSVSIHANVRGTMNGCCGCLHMFTSVLQVSPQILGGGFKYVLFSPLPGEMIQFDEYFSNS